MPFHLPEILGGGRNGGQPAAVHQNRRRQLQNRPEAKIPTDSGSTVRRPITRGFLAVKAFYPSTEGCGIVMAQGTADRFQPVQPATAAKNAFHGYRGFGRAVAGGFGVEQGGE